MRRCARIIVHQGRSVRQDAGYRHDRCNFKAFSITGVLPDTIYPVTCLPGTPPHSSGVPRLLSNRCPAGHPLTRCPASGRCNAPVGAYNNTFIQQYVHTTIRSQIYSHNLQKKIAINKIKKSVSSVLIFFCTLPSQTFFLCDFYNRRYVLQHNSL